jgi:ribosomal protein S2
MINQQKIKQFQQMQSHIGAVEINSWMFPYVLGFRDRVPFFNIDETLIATQKALNFIQHVHKEKGNYFISQYKPTFWDH